MAVKITKPAIDVRDKLTQQERKIDTTEVVAKKVNATEELELPSGTSADRPLVPDTGSTRWNTETNELEIYNGTDWLAISVDYNATGSTILG